MADYISIVLNGLVRAGVIALVANEVRGFAVAGPVLYGMYKAGGTGMALWVGLCTLAGIAISVFLPMVIAKKLRLLPVRAR